MDHPYKCRSWRTSTIATRCPNRAADNTLVGSERRFAVARTARMVRIPAQFHERALAAGAWWVRSMSGPWSHSLPRTGPRFEFVTDCDHRGGRRLRLTSPSITEGLNRSVLRPLTGLLRSDALSLTHGAPDIRRYRAQPSVVTPRYSDTHGVGGARIGESALKPRTFSRTAN